MFMIILAVPAFIGWIIPYFCFLSISKKKMVQATQKYAEIYEVCERANGLLAFSTQK